MSPNVSVFIRKWIHILVNVIPLIVLGLTDLYSTITNTPSFASQINPIYYKFILETILGLNILRSWLKKYDNE